MADPRTPGDRELREIAAAATPGPWTHDEPYLRAVRSRALFGREVCTAHIGTAEFPPPFQGPDVNITYPDATYIATFDPPTVTALLDVVEAARGTEEAKECRNYPAGSRYRCTDPGQPSYSSIIELPCLFCALTELRQEAGGAMTDRQPTSVADMRVVVAGFPESGLRDIAAALLDRLAAAEARAERAEGERDRLSDEHDLALALMDRHVRAVFDQAVEKKRAALTALDEGEA